MSVQYSERTLGPRALPCAAALFALVLGACASRPDPAVGAWRLDWFAMEAASAERDPAFAAAQDATPTRWIVLLAGGCGALVSAEGATVVADPLMVPIAVEADGRRAPEPETPSYPPIEFVWWRVGDHFFARGPTGPDSDATEAVLENGRLATLGDGWTYILKRDPCPPAGVLRRLRGQAPTATPATPPRFFEFLR